MQAGQVVTLVQQLNGHGQRAWVAGGWAVDALVGAQTREHADLDLAVNADRLDAIVSVLSQLGFALSMDQLPIRAEFTAPDGRCVDLHPVRFAADGSGVQAGPAGTSFAYSADGFTDGVLDEHPVPCLSCPQQLAFRDGYELRPVDRHDLALLRALRRGEAPP